VGGFELQGLAVRVSSMLLLFLARVYRPSSSSRARQGIQYARAPMGTVQLKTRKTINSSKKRSSMLLTRTARPWSSKHPRAISHLLFAFVSCFVCCLVFFVCFFCVFVRLGVCPRSFVRFVFLSFVYFFSSCYRRHELRRNFQDERNRDSGAVLVGSGHVRLTNCCRCVRD